MVDYSGGGLVEEGVIISGLVGVQVVLAFYMVFLHRILALGIDSLFFAITGSFVTTILLLPFAVALEKKKWPRRLSPVLMVQMMSIGAALTAYQVLLLYGIKMTSPAIASAMPNLGPGMIFIIAACLGFEKFSIRCKYSRTKVLGTVVCLGGTLAMSFLMNPATEPELTSFRGSVIVAAPVGATSLSKEWIFGCLYLLTAILSLSACTVLQAAAMVNFPAPVSLSVVSSLIASVASALVKFARDGKIDAGSSGLNVTTIIAFVLTGAVLSGMCSTYITWCVKKKGPVIVSVFNPIQAMCSAILSAVVLRQVISFGCLAGMLFIFAGLYIVLWAKKKEGIEDVNAESNVASVVDDIEKPLLV